MSPATIEAPVKPTKTTKLPTGLSGAFLDLAPIDYGLETEKEGKDGVAPAKVRIPVSTACIPALTILSIPIIFQLGLM